MPHEHKWGRGYREVDVPVIDGVATMPDGRTIQSTANIIRYPEPIDDFVCGVCGATRDAPAEHPQTPRTVHHFDFTGPVAVHQTVIDNEVVEEETFDNPVPGQVAAFFDELEANR